MAHKSYKSQIAVLEMNGQSVLGRNRLCHPIGDARSQWQFRLKIRHIRLFQLQRHQSAVPLQQKYSLGLFRNKSRSELRKFCQKLRINRSNIDQIFTFRQIAQKYDELYICYTDFCKAFDRIWHKGLWKVLRHYIYHEKLVRLLESHTRTVVSVVRATMQVNGKMGNLTPCHAHTP